jgi:hypothetical protein
MISHATHWPIFRWIDTIFSVPILGFICNPLVRLKNFQTQKTGEGRVCSDFPGPSLKKIREFGGRQNPPRN